jgi:ATP-dependent Lon protease
MATTNTLDLKPALLDRLEIIEISGYTQEEKSMIAKNYILPKLEKEYGINEEEINIGDQEINSIIREYTYEAGVRGLEQKLAQLVRKAMCTLEENENSALPKEKTTINIGTAEIKKFLGHPTYTPELRGEKPEIGIATGLAYVKKREGQEGEVLYIEAKMVPGNGKVECTGRLGEVMKESAQVAFKYMLANAEQYKIDISILKEKNIHIHLPAGAVPKDGPSAGVAMFCAMLSAIKNIPIRSDIAITGEISLYKVLKVGGIKEKTLAAYRRTPKINTIFLPYDNINDLDDVPQEIKDSIEIVPIKCVNDVVEKAFII